MPKPDYVYLKREFLNELGYHSNAFVYAHLDSSGWGELVIGDCSRQVTISVQSTTDEGETQNSLRKLEMLETTIRELRRALVKTKKRRARGSRRA